jgi:hypothetical protein
LRLQLDTKLASALDELLQQARELAELGVRSALDGATALKERLERPVAGFEVVTFDTADMAQVPAVLAALGLTEGESVIDGLAMRVRHCPFSAVTSYRLDELRPLLRVCVVGAAAPAEWGDQLVAMAGDSPWMLVVHHGGLRLPAELRSTLEAERTLVEELTLEQLSSKALPSRLTEPAFQGALNLLFNLTVANTLERLEHVLGLSLQQEERNLKARKALNQQQVIKVQARGPGSASDAATQLKQLLTQQMNQLEKGLTDQVEGLFRSQTGTFTKLVDHELEGLQELEGQKTSKATVMGVPQAFEEQFMVRLHAGLLRSGLNDLTMMRDGMRSLEQDLERAACKAGLAAPTLQFKLLTDKPLQELLANTLQMERRYEGSMARKGFYEFFMAIRKYQMIAFMILSTLGLSFMRDLRYIMIPLTLVLLGLGAVFVARAMRREREEGGDKELGKAQDSLRNEARRMGTEYMRQWTRLLSEHLRGQLTHNSLAMENQLKEQAQRQAASDEEEKRRVQRLVQSAEHGERKFINLQRAHENLQRNLARLKSDVRQIFLQQARTLTT